jgi:hypothetical protein
MNQDGAPQLREATMQAVITAGPQVVMEYYEQHGGPALTIALNVEVLERLAEQQNGINRARQWLEARVREVADLSPETIEHYLNFVLRQQLDTFPEQLLETSRVQVLPWCALANGSRPIGLCATCAVSRKYACEDLSCALPRVS